MRVLDIPETKTPLVLDLGYRKLTLAPGKRPYPDEVANHPAMAQYLEPPPPAPAPPAPKAKSGDAA